MNVLPLPSAIKEGFIPDNKQEAVISAPVDEWLLVSAGPGTGKTQVSAMRLAHLLRKGLLPAQILVLSFSRSAVSALTRRLAALGVADPHVGEDLRHLSIRTFDSWTFRVLRQNGSAVSHLLARTHDENIAELTFAMQTGTNSVLRERLAPVKHVIIDEFQDLPGVRSRLVLTLLSFLNSPGQAKIGFTVLGDSAQAIYRFASRAAGDITDEDPWSDLRDQFGGALREISLGRNYRAMGSLANAAAALRGQLQDEAASPVAKLAMVQAYLQSLPTLSCDGKVGPSMLATVPEGSVALLTRTNGEALQVAKMLNGMGTAGPPCRIRLQLAGRTASVPAWVAVLLGKIKPNVISHTTFDAIYTLIINPMDGSVKTALGIPSREVAWVRLARASGSDDFASAIKIDEICRRLEWPDSFPDDQSANDDGIFVTTIHQAKGMEFDDVVLLESRLREDEPEGDPLEEASVGFVAVTRAAHRLNRLPASCIYKAPSEWRLPSGRSRLGSWSTMISVQMGLPGDVAAESFVDIKLHAGEEGVSALQQRLMMGAVELRGHKVVLKKQDVPSRQAQYEIFLQNDQKAGLRLGLTSKQFTYDLLGILWNRGYSLPLTIYNLRIAEIVTLCGGGELPKEVPEPWRSSHLWLGVTLFGTGDFKTGKRKGG